MKKTTKKQQNCKHLFVTDEPATYKLVDGGINKAVVCEKCNLKAHELYLVVCIHTGDGQIIEEY